jgi:hypothetical protein
MSTNGGGKGAKAKVRNARSPWRRGPMCDTPNAVKSYKRYVARGRRNAQAVRHG